MVNRGGQGRIGETLMTKPPIEKYEVGNRKCAHCKTPLSGYNKGKLCGACKQLALDAKHLPTDVKTSATQSGRLCQTQRFREREELPSHQEMRRASFARSRKPFNAFETRPKPA